MKNTKPTRYKIQTLAQLGSQLPVGVVSAGTLDKALDLIPYQMKQERELAKMRRPGSGVGAYVEAAMSLLVKQFGPHNVASMEDKGTRKLVFSQAYLADILYAYLYIRYAALGPQFPLLMRCPACRNAQQVVGDLDTLEVEVATDTKQLTWPLELRDGVKIGGQVRRSLTLQPPVWGQLDVSRFDDEGLRQIMMLKAALVTAEGLDGPPVLFDADVDEMSKWDVELISKSIEDNSPGPRMLIESRCERCSSEMFGLLEWASEGFFSMPSQSPLRKS